MKINNQKKKFLSLLGVFLIVGIFVIVPEAKASWAADVVGGILEIIISALGLILVLAMEVLISVAQYSNFINAPAVENGWVIIRDMCNMFFVLILLIIAFATILKLENYSYKKWLPKLILMAILINFSKTICGLLIDVAQVVMLTFVNAFKGMAAGNLVQNLGIKEIVTLASNGGDVGFWAIVGAYFLGLIYVIISLVVILTMVAMLAMRIVMIWIYVVLSPLAYLMASFPGGQKYSGQWWSEFTKNLIVGPVLAFFIWLSFAALQDGAVIKDFPVQGTSDIEARAAQGGIVNSGDISSETTEAAKPEVVLRFVIAIGMLIGGLKIAQEIGGAAGGMAGKGIQKLQKGAALGVGAVGAITGYRYASGVMKSYASKRRAKREERYSLGAERMVSKIGGAKKAVGSTISDGLARARGGISKRITNKFGKSDIEIQKFAQEAEDKRAEIKKLRTKFTKREEIEGFRYNVANNKWEDGTEQLEDKEFENKHLNPKVAGLEREAEDNENKVTKEEKRRRRTDKALKVGGNIALGAGIGAILGVPGMIAGGALGNKAMSKLKRAGKDDMDIGSNWRLRKVTEARDKMKNDSDKEILATMDDSGKDVFERAAAAMESISRDIISDPEAKKKKQELKQTLGGVNKEGSWRDKKVGSYIENTYDRYMPGLGRDFEEIEAAEKNPDLISPDANKKQAAQDRLAKAEKKVTDRIGEGKYTLDLDTGTLERSMNYFANTLRNGDFVKQYKSLKNQTKKDAIVEMLKNQDSQKAKEKLASIKDLQLAFGKDQAGKEIALSDMSMEDLLDAWKSGGEKQQAIMDTVKNSARPQSERIKIFTKAENSLRGKNPAVKDVYNDLFVKNI